MKLILFLPRTCYGFLLRMYFIEPGRSLEGHRKARELLLHFLNVSTDNSVLFMLALIENRIWLKHIFYALFRFFIVFFGKKHTSSLNILVMLCTYSSFCLWNIKTSAILSWNLYNPSNFMQHALSDVMWNTNLTLKSFLSSRSNLSQGKIMSSKSFWSHIFTFLFSYFYFENDSN